MPFLADADAHELDGVGDAVEVRKRQGRLVQGRVVEGRKVGRSLWESEEQHAGVVAAGDAAREVWGAGPRDQGEGTAGHNQQPGARAADRDESNPEAMQRNAAHNGRDVSRERAVRGGPVRA